jgi:ribosomal protein S18 acetylase RimI-like enzyme
MTKFTNTVQIKNLTEKDLSLYGKISIAFEVHNIFDVIENNLGKITLTQKTVETPWHKDYDSCEAEGPLSWPKKWSLSNWELLGAFIGGELCGGCALAVNTEGVHMLEGRKDLAVLWDIRVKPIYRHSGIGKLLFSQAVLLAKSKGCKELKVETQNINFYACKFYEKQSCILSEFKRLAYKEFPNEIQLIWRKPI